MTFCNNQAQFLKRSGILCILSSTWLRHKGWTLSLSPISLLTGTVTALACVPCFLIYHWRLLSRDQRRKHSSGSFLLLQNSLEAALGSSAFSRFLCIWNETDHMHVEIVTVNANSSCSISNQNRFPLKKKKK